MPPPSSAIRHHDGFLLHSLPFSKRKKQAASRKIKKFMTILMDIRQYYITMSTVPSSLYVNPKEIMLVIG